MHFIIAIVLMATVLFFAGDFRHQRATTTLGKVTAGAQAAGVRSAKLVSIDGTAITDWSGPDSSPDEGSPACGHACASS